MGTFLRRLPLVFAAAVVPTCVIAQTCNTASRSVLLIMDASGSMNAKLPNGESRIEVARRAVKGVASFIPAEAPIGLRLYGAQSPAKDKNCRDTHLALPFAPAGQAASAIAARVDAAKAQGYTPIAHSLEQTANDFPADAKERVIVVVSDGKETCKGDPCAAAKALGAQGYVIHTVGFVVDTAARMQLQCMARATGGSYFDAPLGPELPGAVESALKACRQEVRLPAKPSPGRLRTTAAGSNNDVFNAETGARVDNLSRVRHEIQLPAGVYEVQFGPARWKGIEVRSGETTTISPGVLRIENRTGGIAVVDSETGEKFGQFDAVTPEVTLVPGLYDLHLSGGKLVWPFVKIDGGKKTTLSLARVSLARDLKWKKARVLTSEGKEVSRFDAVTWHASLSPGDYVIEIDDNKIPFTATEGQVLDIKP